jgi:predicted NodU family carbamoyl transferase
MIVLGIIDSKPSSAAILKDGRILSAIAEERLCRMKMASGMPRPSHPAGDDGCGCFCKGY